MLAYLFWHEPRPDVDADAYVGRLQAFHRALAAAPPPSFVRSWSVRLAVAPWDAGPTRPFEDWYLVEDWAALGTLNDAAVRAPRGAAHDAVAAMAASPAGGLYAPQHGSLDGPAPWARVGRQAARRAVRHVRAAAARGGRRGRRRRGAAPSDGPRAGARVRAPRRERAGAPVADPRHRAADALGREHLAPAPQPRWT